MKIPFLLVLISLLFSTTLFSQKKELASKDELYKGKEYKSAFANPKDNPDLPNVLIIGDSISIGYTTSVRKLLKGKADIFRVNDNCRFAAYGTKNLQKWLKGRKYDIIHFNWGLWDLCYRNPKSKNQGSRDKKNGKITATLKEYQANLEQNLKILQKTDAKLIWCATTPVPKGEAGRIEGDAINYNKVAAKIMKKNEVHINDLHTHALKRYKKIQKKRGDVHYNAKGYQYLAEKVAREITNYLK